MSFVIPQNDLRAGYLAHKTAIDAAVSDVLESGWWILGKNVEAFEKAFAEYIGVSDCVGVANGTDAIHLALRACGVGPGDNVATVSHTAVATVAAIEMAGAVPVFIDIDLETFSMDISQLETILMSRTIPIKAVIPVHLYGYPLEISRLMALSRKNNFLVIEDCAQAHGAFYEGKRVGSFGHLSAFSFYPTKNLGACGDGGAVCTSNEGFAHRLKILREYGWEQRYISNIPGFNSRLDELQAGILSVKLGHLNEENQQRRDIARRYHSGLERLSPRISLPSAKNDGHVFHQYVIRTDNRDELKTHLAAKGIGTLIHYPVPIHLQPAYAGRVPLAESLKNTEEVARSVLSLPMFPRMSADQVEMTIQAVQAWAKGAA